jgi:hypothetical protein
MLVWVAPTTVVRDISMQTLVMGNACPTQLQVQFFLQDVPLWMDDQ